MGISRDSWHKRRKTGGKMPVIRKKRKYEMGRQAANTKLSTKEVVRPVRCRGGNKKYRALRLCTGSFSWPSEGFTKRARINDVVYNCTSNELLRTKTIVKGCILSIDASPFRTLYENYYGRILPRKKGETFQVLPTLPEDVASRQSDAELSQSLMDQFISGKLLAIVTSRPGQHGRCDGYILEGAELDFYVKKLRAKKTQS